MAKKKYLNTTEARALKKEGLHCVSDNLYLQIRKAKSGITTLRWMFRYTPAAVLDPVTGKPCQREPIKMVLGLVDLAAKEGEDGKSGLSLAQARAKADEERGMDCHCSQAGVGPPNPLSKTERGRKMQKKTPYADLDDIVKISKQWPQDVRPAWT